ncbi:DUF4352 domain-containing protein [Streptomyces sp. MUM 178J]|uniref:DUF4352 domain-containing protein n=1 Tax=Streptomyces sp. MUM 178J TaxID=2791991 RepID=UPI0023D957AE|nr:DUF4352 domain-containing protein [Streptomyces sp. MUM 178J]WRQ79530.1 DUF4352 domain-containing protein [Streptomyces sp. MUM 178J]
MRIHHAAAAVTSAAMLAALTGCFGPSEVTTEPNKPAVKAADEAKAPAEKKAAKVAAVGDTITLTGHDEGLKVDATLKQWLDPAKSADEYIQPQDGKRWVAAQFELANTGTAVYDDSPSNGTQVADADGQRFHSGYGEISAGPLMTSAAKVPPGDKVLGWIVYEVPKDSKITKVQFGLNSGFADQTGQWAVK